MEYYELKHSVQIYWESIGFALSELNDTLNDVLYKDMISNASNAAFKCSETYGKLICNSSTRNHYTECEKQFYNNLSAFIENHQIRSELQNIVHNELNNGTRFFDHFLYAIGIVSS